RAFMPAAYNDLGRNTTAMSNVCSHNMGFFGTPGPGWAVIYLDSTGPTPTLLVNGGFNAAATRLTLANPTSVTAQDIAAPGNNGPINMIGVHQLLYYTCLNATPAGTVNVVRQNPVGTLFTTLLQTLPSFPWPGDCLAGAQIGNRTYIAVAFQNNPGGGSPLSGVVRLYDVGLDSVTVTSTTDITIEGGRFFESMTFLGSGLVIATTDGTQGNITLYDIPSGTATTIARIQNSTGPRITEVAGSIFVLAANQAGVGRMTI